jgi:hypothetical protein
MQYSSLLMHVLASYLEGSGSSVQLSIAVAVRSHCSCLFLCRAVLRNQWNGYRSGQQRMTRQWAHWDLVSCWYKQEFHFGTAICCIAGVWQTTLMVIPAELRIAYALYDHKTNDSIRRELQTDCILDKIDEYGRNWLLHQQRMSQNRIPWKSYHYSPQGKRTIGRPKKRWREQL